MFSTEELDEINNAQRLYADRTAMSLNPPYKRFLPGQAIEFEEIKPFPKIRFQETPEYWDERKRDDSCN